MKCAIDQMMVTLLTVLTLNYSCRTRNEEALSGLNDNTIDFTGLSNDQFDQNRSTITILKRSNNKESKYPIGEILGKKNFITPGSYTFSFSIYLKAKEGLFASTIDGNKRCPPKPSEIAKGPNKITITLCKSTPKNKDDELFVPEEQNPETELDVDIEIVENPEDIHNSRKIKQSSIASLKTNVSSIISLAGKLSTGLKFDSLPSRQKTDIQGLTISAQGFFSAMETIEKKLNGENTSNFDFAKSHLTGSINLLIDSLSALNAYLNSRDKENFGTDSSMLFPLQFRNALFDLKGSWAKYLANPVQ